MREIKFRTWNKNTSLIEKMNYQPFTDSYYSTDEGTLLNDFFTDSNFVFMQYTGLKDKNDVEIYEGDYILVSGYDYEEPSDDWEGIVTMGQFGWGILGYNSNGNKAFYYLNEIGGSYTTIWEVISNICENPELLD